jgi:hypothetical protein
MLYTLELADGNMVQVLSSGESDHPLGARRGLRVTAARLSAFATDGAAQAPPDPGLRS